MSLEAALRFLEGQLCYSASQNDEYPRRLNF